VKTPDDDSSLDPGIGENSGDHILHNDHELHVNQLKQEAGMFDNIITKYV
jgi:hypothetical protein